MVACSVPAMFSVAGWLTKTSKIFQKRTGLVKFFTSSHDKAASLGAPASRRRCARTRISPARRRRSQAMKAIRLTQLGRPLEAQEIGLPIIGPKDILVRIKAAGICHSDAHYRA